MNTTESVKKRISEMKAARAAELEKIEAKRKESQELIKAAEKDMQKAAELTDGETFNAAYKAKEKAITALEMYTLRRDQIARAEYISEEESDSVIDSLLEYEKTLDNEFLTAAAAQIRELSKLYEYYADQISETEKTLREWQQDIHANYRTRGVTTWKDPETGERTDRSNKPVLIRIHPYKGCKESAKIREFLENMQPLIKA